MYLFSKLVCTSISFQWSGERRGLKDLHVNTFANITVMLMKEFCFNSHCGTYNNESIIVCLKIQSLEVTVAAFQLLAARLLIRQ